MYVKHINLGGRVTRRDEEGDRRLRACIAVWKWKLFDDEPSFPALEDCAPLQSKAVQEFVVFGQQTEIVGGRTVTVIDIFRCEANFFDAARFSRP